MLLSQLGVVARRALLLPKSARHSFFATAAKSSVPRSAAASQRGARRPAVLRAAARAVVSLYKPEAAWRAACASYSSDSAASSHDEPTAPSLHYDNDHLARILKTCKVVACVGLSGDWKRPSNFAMKYLQQKVRRQLVCCMRGVVAIFRVHFLSAVPAAADATDMATTWAGLQTMRHLQQAPGRPPNRRRVACAIVRACVVRCVIF